MFESIDSFTRDSVPCATPADIARQLRKARLIRIYGYYRAEIAYGQHQRVYRMPAVEALKDARRHIMAMGA